jgi:hypothetical protein
VVALVLGDMFQNVRFVISFWIKLCLSRVHVHVKLVQGIPVHKVPVLQGSMVEIAVSFGILKNILKPLHEFSYHCRHTMDMRIVLDS